MSTQRSRRFVTARSLRSERGAVIVHVAVAILGLLALSAFVIDYGVLWAARRQAQNSADAAALAGAVSMGFVDMNDQNLARTSAMNVAAQNPVWGAPPNIAAGDVTFPLCPPGSPGAGVATCIQVDLYRNQERNNPLPVFFAGLAGVANQGVRATATAQALFGNSSDCVKPFAIADKWLELANNSGPAGWDPTDTFERYEQNGRNRGQVLSPADVYTPPSGTDPGTGFTRESVTNGGDYGLQIVLKSGSPNQAIAPGWYHPVVINPAEGPGGSNYRDNIATCDPTVIGPGTVLQVEPGNMVGPTRQGMDDLIALDPNARWDTSANDGRGGIVDSAYGISPRLVAIPVFDPDAYDTGRASGRVDITVVKVLGFFAERMNGNEVVGRLMSVPGPPRAGTAPPAGSAFVISVALVR